MNKQGNTLQAFAGYALNLFRLARFDVRNPHSLTKYRALRATQERTGAKTLLETGTYLGVTTRRCAPHFDKVYTIELAPDLARQARSWLAPFSNVTVVEGDAEKEVRRLLTDLDLRDVLVFLDGHFSGGETACGDQAEPAVTLLEFLAEHADKISGIVVDDFRGFGSEAGWPKKWQLVKAAEELFGAKGFRITVHFDLMLIERLSARA